MQGVPQKKMEALGQGEGAGGSVKPELRSTHRSLRHQYPNVKRHYTARANSHSSVDKTLKTRKRAHFLIQPNM